MTPWRNIGISEQGLIAVLFMSNPSIAATIADQMLLRTWIIRVFENV